MLPPVSAIIALAPSSEIVTSIDATVKNMIGQTNNGKYPLQGQLQRQNMLTIFDETSCNGAISLGHVALDSTMSFNNDTG